MEISKYFNQDTYTQKYVSAEEMKQAFIDGANSAASLFKATTPAPEAIQYPDYTDQTNAPEGILWTAFEDGFMKTFRRRDAQHPICKMDEEVYRTALMLGMLITESPDINTATACRAVVYYYEFYPNSQEVIDSMTRIDDNDNPASTANYNAANHAVAHAAFFDLHQQEEAS